MHILVKTLTGKALSYNLEKNQKVSDLKAQIEETTGIPLEEQSLILNNLNLTEDFSFESLVNDTTEMYLVVALEGGAKGKKKKKDVKKSKKPHKKRKVKMAVLKYYKVEGDKVVKLKQMCKTCPAGTFVAEHADRLYCGRCHATYAKAVDSKKGQEKPAQKAAPKQVEEKVEEKKGKGKGKK